jgi:hypothetical protein
LGEINLFANESSHEICSKLDGTTSNSSCRADPKRQLAVVAQLPDELQQRPCVRHFRVAVVPEGTSNSTSENVPTALRTSSACRRLQVCRKDANRSDALRWSALFQPRV